jgi:glutamate N-acetyltransferase/amino-acid N-acetyltransferase
MVRNGTPTNYSESRATEIISAESVFVLLTCGMGDGWTTIWTCDLSHEYVSINADYRT